MHPFENEAGRNGSAVEESIERLYDASVGVLTLVLGDSFAVPPKDAQVIVENAVSALMTSSRPDDADAWLIAAVCKSARAYLRQRGLDASLLPEVTADRWQKMKDVVILRDALAGLPEAAGQAMRLHAEGNRSDREIAQKLGVSTHYARHLIRLAARRIREEQRRREPQPEPEQ